MSKKNERAAMTQARLKELLDYDPETGALTWRARVGETGAIAQWNPKYAGKRAGTINKNNYTYVGINNVIYMESRVIWQWMTDEQPSRVWFVNGDTQDFRWANLTVRRSNDQSRRRYLMAKWGYPGIEQPSPNRWIAAINYRGQKERHGPFATREEAIEARREAERRLWKTT